MSYAEARRPRLPTGWRRVAFRLPILAYRLRLSWLFGSRFLLVNHIGRKTGLSCQAVIEVVDHDTDAGAWTVASGFGRKAAWYRNLRQTPDVTIQVGRREYAVTARFLTADEGGAAMRRYAERYPKTAKLLASFMGFPVDDTSSDYQAIGEQIPFVRFESR
ncbi:MAG: nitroreductase family deazaflavin-dependent oxidoreductase [Actinophytocola sp.]|nr:nitroreductase family deazaflavin-dependent oxidoreductase [Actinophytocola sp.]